MLISSIKLWFETIWHKFNGALRNNVWCYLTQNRSTVIQEKAPRNTGSKMLVIPFRKQGVKQRVLLYLRSIYQLKICRASFRNHGCVTRSWRIRQRSETMSMSITIAIYDGFRLNINACDAEDEIIMNDAQVSVVANDLLGVKLSSTNSKLGELPPIIHMMNRDNKCLASGWEKPEPARWDVYPHKAD